MSRKAEIVPPPTALLYLSFEDQKGNGPKSSTLYFAKSIAAYLGLAFSKKVVKIGEDPNEKFGDFVKDRNASKTILWIAAHGNKDGSLDTCTGSRELSFKNWSNSLNKSNFHAILIDACSVGKKIKSTNCDQWGCQWVLAAEAESDWYAMLCAYAKALEWLFLNDLEEGEIDIQDDRRKLGSVKAQILDGLSKDWGRTGDEKIEFASLFKGNKIVLITPEEKVYL